MSYQKLVRDLIPKRIIAGGEVPIIHILDDVQYRAELEKKLLEECAEFVASPSAEEAGDVLTVLHTLASMHQISLQQINDAAAKKYQTHGGFEKKIFLERVDTNTAKIQK